MENFSMLNGTSNGISNGDECIETSASSSRDAVPTSQTSRSNSPLAPEVCADSSPPTQTSPTKAAPTPVLVHEVCAAKPPSNVAELSTKADDNVDSESSSVIVKQEHGSAKNESSAHACSTRLDSESDSSSRVSETADHLQEASGADRVSPEVEPRCGRTPTELSFCSQESDDSDVLLSELESELDGGELSESSRALWHMRNGSKQGFREHTMGADVLEKLQQSNAQLMSQVAALKDQISIQESEHQRVLAQTRAELLSRNEKLVKQQEAITKEKDAMVVRYATSEREVIVARKALEDAERRQKDLVKERDQYFSRVRSLNNERARLCSSLDTKLVDIAKLQKEQEKLKEELSSRDIKIKWAQNKLKTEVDAHKETQVKLEQCQMRLRQTREEAEQVRKDCQEMVRKYQESEEIKSASLDNELRKKESELEEQKLVKENQEEVYQMIKQESEMLKKKHKLNIEENNTLTMKIHNLEKERLEYEQTLSKLKEKLNALNQEIVDLTGKLDEKKNLELQMEREREKVAAAQQEVERMRQTNAELQADMEACHIKEGELLEFTEKLTTKSVQLQSEHTLLELKAQNLEEENTNLMQQVSRLEKDSEELTASLEQEKRQRQQENQLLARKLAEKTKLVEQLTVKVEDAENEQKVMKRRHISSVKELSRELQQSRKRLEQYETSPPSSHQQPSSEVASLGSRASSTTSLETIGTSMHSMPHPASGHPTVSFVNAGRPAVRTRRAFMHASRSAALTNSASESATSSSAPSPHQSPAPLEVDKQLLVERIVRLQKNLAKKNDKIEFLEEHVNQLLTEIKKKSKIIQNYITREEAGALVPTAMDKNKAELSKKGGIMASVYNCQPVDTSMTLDLSLEINRKLQAVLEDTLLKNITLKENINTLGEEIARLTRERSRVK
ncbi:coiled-coil domain-containing protein 186-like isoform X2 [Ornithodoros turicata]|uniref:coiled-coil domain-containing protein 186-like isoform X2 n=1 Tax=Ornithodoros turicata TaxID=34597 RepID=UPI0031398E6C